jgi:dUTP pyrophosphatase
MKKMGIFNKKTKVKIKLLNENAKLPVKSHFDDACFDLIAISKKETSQYVEFGTGMAIEIPYGYVGLLFPRSSVTKHDLMLKNAVGVIDAGYRGELMCRFVHVYNDIHSVSFYTGSGFGGHSKTCIDTKLLQRTPELYNVGDRIAQIMFIKLPEIELELVKELKDSKRGVGGYGHTGK